VRDGLCRQPQRGRNGNPAPDTMTSIARRAVLAISAVGITLCACGRRQLQPEQIERNRLFAEILRYEDSRSLGGGGFFPVHLSDPTRPGVQVWCARALGRIGNSQALPWLYNSLHSPMAAVRAAAAFAVGEIEDRDLIHNEGRSPDLRAVSELKALLKDTAPDVRMRAIEALGKVGRESDALEIIGHLEKMPVKGSAEQHTYFALAVTALMRLKNPAAMPVLERIAESGEPDLQWRVANALYRMRDRRACTLLKRLLQSPDADVRAHAARALGICGEPELAPLLTPLLPPADVKSGRPVPLSVRICALQSLGMMRAVKAVPAVEQALHSAPIGTANAGQRDQFNFAVQAAHALGAIGSAEAVDTLHSLLDIPGPVSEAAVVALALILRGDPDRFFSLASGSRFPGVRGQRAWAEALGELGDPRAEKLLKDMLARNAAETASPTGVLMIPACLRALTRMRASGLQDILETCLTMHDGAVVRAAADAYAPAAGSAAPWQPLVEAFHGIAGEADPETKTAILNRLESWTTEADVQAFLLGVLQDPERPARIAAARLLRTAGVPDIPADPGPSRVALTGLGYGMIAAGRKDRAVAVIETTGGTVEIQLFREDASLTVANFVALARRGYFDGLTFMRVVPYFVIQGGDPRNDQEGGPGYSIRCEINSRPFERGSVGMAHAGKDTGGSQFFITLSPQPHLDGGYTCFGRVISGMQAVEHMVETDRILRVRIEEEVTALDYRQF
jgi:cyclophilin family peptidyl-prolyl cis-trans isomerase/HEAT repeat protein